MRRHGPSCSCSWCWRWRQDAIKFRLDFQRNSAVHPERLHPPTTAGIDTPIEAASPPDQTGDQK